MSSGFVPATSSTSPTSKSSDGTDTAWAAARASVAASAAPPSDQLADNRSLYEILQANKAKKQEEFEEKLRFKNQFKPLDEDDVEYLDSVIDGQKRVELERRQEEAKRVDEFRRLQSEADKPQVGGESEEAMEDVGGWRKRKRKEHAGNAGKVALGLKVRRTSEGRQVELSKPDEIADEVKASDGGRDGREKDGKGSEKLGKETVTKGPSSPPVTMPKKPALGLVEYSDDSDDE